jgi:uncharacterized protein YecE (DUF72 family)
MTTGASRAAERILIGTAGWSIPRASAYRFAASGTHLQRYSSILRCVEINSCFYRSHARATYTRWAAEARPAFQFAVKLPRTITHDQQLRRARVPLERFLEDTGGLGDKRGPILVQLPPALAFDVRVAGRFFDCFRERYGGLVVCEPRHQTWFCDAADRLLDRHEVARVAADPPRGPGDGAPGGWRGISYFRLHGSPRTYWSRYDRAFIERLARELLASASGEVWCVFDNTAAGAAIENALELQTVLASDPVRIESPTSGRRVIARQRRA